MKNYIAPEIEVIATDVVDVLNQSTIGIGDVDVNVGEGFFL